MEETSCETGVFESCGTSCSLGHTFNGDSLVAHNGVLVPSHILSCESPGTL